MYILLQNNYVYILSREKYVKKRRQFYLCKSHFYRENKLEHFRKIVNFLLNI